MDACCLDATSASLDAAIGIAAEAFPCETGDSPGEIVVSDIGNLFDAISNVMDKCDRRRHRLSDG